MFKIGDYVVYGSSGICKVSDIEKMKFSETDDEKEYYVLLPMGSVNSSVYVPVDNVRIVIRSVIDKEEAQKVIDEISDIEEIEIASDKLREERYREWAKLCDLRKWVSILKTICTRKKVRLEQGKKITAVDDKYFRLAEDNLYSELSFALGMQKVEIEKEVRAIIGI